MSAVKIEPTAVIFGARHPKAKRKVMGKEQVKAKRKKKKKKKRFDFGCLQTGGKQHTIPPTLKTT